MMQSMSPTDDQVFKALADSSRRTLLDLLREHDGQSLAELQAHLPMTRFGCMSHLKVLEEAGLLTTKKVGREKLHYLNPVPIQLVYDRWVSKYARDWTRPMAMLKYELEEEHMDEAPADVLVVYIRTTPEKLWRALTDKALTSQYYFGCEIDSTWDVGASVQYRYPSGEVMLDGEILEIDAPRRLVTTFKPQWGSNPGLRAPSKVEFLIEPEDGVVKFTVTHSGLPAEHGTRHSDGWQKILSGLKTLLETGTSLDLFAE